MMHEEKLFFDPKRIFANKNPIYTTESTTKNNKIDHDVNELLANLAEQSRKITEPSLDEELIKTSISPDNNISSIEPDLLIEKNKENITFCSSEDKSFKEFSSSGNCDKSSLTEANNIPNKESNSSNKNPTLNSAKKSGKSFNSTSFNSKTLSQAENHDCNENNLQNSLNKNNDKVRQTLSEKENPVKKNESLIEEPNNNNILNSNQKLKANKIIKDKFSEKINREILKNLKLKHSNLTNAHYSHFKVKDKSIFDRYKWLNMVKIYYKTSPLEHYVQKSNQFVKDSLIFSWNAIKLLLGIIFILLLFLLKLTLGLISIACSRAKNIYRKKWLGLDTDEPVKSINTWKQGTFLTENITLPETDIQAINRLFACKGKDPYSILGLHPNCTEEDIKRYYRKQAVLVHPDKTCEPGAEEAFKILSAAFEIIGDSETKKKYDLQSSQEREATAAMHNFTDLLTKLHETIKENLDMMSCICGKKHRRYLCDRNLLNARFCDKCNTFHLAKKGDIWAETSMWRLKKKILACMEDGNIYDITDWACCQGLKQLPPNSHTIRAKLGKNKNKHYAFNDSDLTDLLSKFSKDPSGLGTTGTNKNPMSSSGTKKFTSRTSTFSTESAQPSTSYNNNGNVNTDTFAKFPKNKNKKKKR